MKFSELSLDVEYKIPRDNVVEKLYIPVLSNSIEYKRAVGYFSSTALIEFTRGIMGLVRNGGKIKLVTSPNLSAEDYEAINKGYQELDTILETRMISSIFAPKDYFEEERLNIVANLIASGDLEIKIAFSNRDGNLGLFHEKKAILQNVDSDEVIAFSGSMNETESALNFNYETIDVFTSWSDKKRVEKKSSDFNDLWEDCDKNAKVYSFPEAVKKSILTYKKDSVNLEIDNEEIDKIRRELEKIDNKPKFPEWLSLRYYQKQAIENWVNSNFKGIFDMATGTGKTLTGLAAIMNLYESKKGKIAIVICAPYQHLVDQWCEDLDAFNIKYTVGHSSSKQKNWKKNLKKEVFDYNNGIREYLCFITTNASFKTKYVQNLLSTITKNKLLVVDEAHNFGAEGLQRLLNNSYNFRLALSATITRHNDDDGTEALLDFFGEKCISYGLAEAIEQKMLTPYKYYPIPVYLDEEELEKYYLLSDEIAKCIIKTKNGKVKLSIKGKRLALERSRIIAGAKDKLIRLEEIMHIYKEARNILVYCGAARVGLDDDMDYNSSDPDLRQIEMVEQILSWRLGMTVSQFTSQETTAERQEIKMDFESGRTQAVVAIKCLDEGVNIPSIENVFILASSTNPKEYIQRRGRVLRLFEGKKFATIYDFIVLPRELDTIVSTDDVEYDLRLVKRELTRVKEFADLSLNPIDSDELIFNIEMAYGTVFNNMEDEIYV